MANSTQVAVSDGSLALLDISIDYLSRPEITVYFDAVLTTDWAWVGDSDKQITFDPVVPLGVEVLVKRTTDISALRHTFSLGAAFTTQSLDEDLKQVLHIAQEASEANFGGDFYGDINMHYNRITNVADAVDPTDVPTFRQLGEFRDAAAASAAAAASSYDSFDDRYLGPKAVEPALDNDGGALLTGALYWDTVASAMKVYTGAAWDFAYAVGTEFALRTDVEAALDELQTDVDTRATTAALTAHIDDTADAHDASAISYNGGTGMAATDVEAALDELATGKAADASTQTIFIPAGAMKADPTSGPSTATVELTNGPNITTLDFAPASDELAQFAIRMPKGWNEGTVTFVPSWSHAATTTNFGVAWFLQAVAISNDDTLDVAFGTAVSSVDTGGTTNDLYIGPASSAMTIAGTPAAEDLVQFQIYRDVSDAGDTLAVDARLHGITIYYTTESLSDA
jgi:hypothetical protein